MDKKNIVSTPQFEINENVIRYDQTIIQLSNVARCEVGKMPKEPYPIWAIVLGIVGILLLFTRPFKFIAVCLILVSCAILGFIYWKNQELVRYLILELNSGKMLLFTCYNTSFLEDAQKAVIDCFNDRGTAYTINFRNCTINDSQIGKYNEAKVQR